MYIMPEYFESITIVPVKAGHCAKPHKPTGIFKNAVYLVITKAIGDIQLRKLVMFILRPQTNTIMKY